MIRVLGLFFGFCATTYGVLGVWLSHARENKPLKQAFCKAWLCPLEFSPARIYELHNDRQGSKKIEAVSEFARALEANPASAYAWANLGEALANSGDTARAQYCMQRAVIAGPNSPAILLRAANVALSTQKYAGIMTDMAHILQDPNDQQFYPAVFLTYSRMGLNTKDVLEHGVPPRAWSAQALLRFLMVSERISDTSAAWRWIVNHELESDELSSEYLTFLISHQEEHTANEVWAALNANQAPEYDRTNWIFNGGFEHATRPVPLDWQIAQDDDVEVSRSTQARDGKWCLELRFAGLENVQFEGVHQATVLSPGRWRLSAAVRTDGITTDEGIAIRLVDAVQSRRLDVTTDALTGTHGWTQLDRVFEVRPETKLVRVEIFRRSSSRFDNKIAGTAWVDSLELTPVR